MSPEGDVEVLKKAVFTKGFPRHKQPISIIPRRYPFLYPFCPSLFFGGGEGSEGGFGAKGVDGGRRRMPMKREENRGKIGGRQLLPASEPSKPDIRRQLGISLLFAVPLPLFSFTKVQRFYIEIMLHNSHESSST